MISYPRYAAARFQISSTLCRPIGRNLEFFHRCRPFSVNQLNTTARKAPFCDGFLCTTLETLQAGIELHAERIEHHGYEVVLSDGKYDIHKLALVESRAQLSPSIVGDEVVVV